MSVNDGSGECGIRFLCENFVPTSSIELTTGIENAQFPLSNLLDPSKAAYFRSETNVTVIVIDLQQTRAIDTFVILGNPARSFGVTDVSIKTSPGNDFTASVATNIPISIENNMGYVFLEEPVSHRFIEFTFTGTGAFTEIGRILIGAQLYLPYNNLSTDSFKHELVDMSTFAENRYGTRFIDKRPFRKRVNGSIRYCTKEEKDGINDIMIRHGKHEPIFMVPDLGGNSFTDSEYQISIYGYITSELAWSADGGMLYTTSISIDEAL